MLNLIVIERDSLTCNVLINAITWLNSIREFKL